MLMSLENIEIAEEILTPQQVLGRKIAAFRIYRGLSQEELGQKLGYRQGTISHYERGKTEPSFLTVAAIANVLTSGDLSAFL